MRKRMALPTSELLASSDLELIFGVGWITIYNWRNKRDLPFTEIPQGQRHRIGFDPEAVYEWAINKRQRIVDAKPLMDKGVKLDARLRQGFEAGRPVPVPDNYV